jgi:hypothetical protein
MRGFTDSESGKTRATSGHNHVAALRKTADILPAHPALTSWVDEYGTGSGSDRVTRTPRSNDHGREPRRYPLRVLYLLGHWTLTSGEAVQNVGGLMHESQIVNRES